MKATLEKPSPKWLDQYDGTGKKTGRKRVLKLEMVVDIEDFPDALSFDGCTDMELFRPGESDFHVKDVDKALKGVLDVLKMNNATTSDLHERILNFLDSVESQNEEG